MSFARTRLRVIEVACLLVGGVLVPAAFGGIVYNSKCKPITMPVMSCGCPSPLIPTDICQKAIPPSGTMYGNVNCQMDTNPTCISSPDGAGNSCGIVMQCPSPPCNYSCETPIVMGICTCTPHPTKPPCTTTWGYCATN